MSAFSLLQLPSQLPVDLPELAQHIQISGRPVLALLDSGHASFGDVYLHILRKLKNTNFIPLVLIHTNVMGPAKIASYGHLEHAYLYVPPIGSKKMFDLDDSFDCIDFVFGPDSTTVNSAFPTRATVFTTYHGQKFRMQMLYTGATEQAINYFDIKRVQNADYLLSQVRVSGDESDLREHFISQVKQGTRPRKSLRILPSGSLKDDPLIEAFQQSTRVPDSLIYIAGLHDDRDYREEILSTLINDFPNLSVIFRPFPMKHLAQSNTELIARFSKYPNFIPDTNPGYLDTYTKALVAVTETSGSAASFSACSGRPMVCYNPLDTSTATHLEYGREFTAGYFTASLTQLSNAIKVALDNKELFEKRIANWVHDALPKYGQSIDYFVDSIQRLSQGLPIEDAVELNF